MQDVLERPVSSYMHRLFVILDENLSVSSAVKQMHSHNAGTIIVLRANMPMGIVTDSDILDKVVMRGEDSDEIFLKSIMSTPLVTISPKGTVKQALQLMRINQIKRLPITDAFGILGIVTQEALANAVRTSVIDRTFSRYRSQIREQYKPIFGNLGIVLQFSAILLVVPALLGTALGETRSIVGIFFAVLGLSFSGFLLTNIGEKGPMNLKQASIFIVASFIILSLFGSLPYLYMNPFDNDTNSNTNTNSALFVNSLFESASGFTTTGLSIISNPEDLPKSLNFYRSYTNWVGGLSFVYLVMILFFPERKLSAMKSVLGGGLLKVKELLITVVGIFTAYTLILIFLLISFGDTDVFNAVSLTLSTITGGGFLPASDILTPEHIELLAILTIGMIISALPFAFHYHVFSRRGLLTRRTISLEVTVFFILMVLGIIIFYWLAFGQVNIFDSIFHAISGSTTTGFQYLNIQVIPSGAKILLIVLMLVGGTAFSTAGGIKVGRFIVLYEEFTKKSRQKNLDTVTGTSPSTSISSTANPYRSTEYLTTFPNEHRKRNLEEMLGEQARILNRIAIIMSKKVVREILIVIILYVSIALVTGSVLTFLTKSQFEDALFESVSAISTTGLTAGITSVNLDAFSKLILTANMIVGRFEIIAILYIFFAYFRK